MKVRFITIILMTLIVGCKQNIPEFANLKLAEQNIAYAPEIQLIMQQNEMAIKITLDGSTVYDTSHTLSAKDASLVYEGLKKMGVKIYSEGSPEWKNKDATFIADRGEEKSTALKELIEKYDGYFEEQYANLLYAAKSLDKYQNLDKEGSKMNANELDSLGAD